LIFFPEIFLSFYSLSKLELVPVPWRYGAWVGKRRFLKAQCKLQKKTTRQINYKHGSSQLVNYTKVPSCRGVAKKRYPLQTNGPKKKKAAVAVPMGSTWSGIKLPLILQNGACHSMGSLGS
jgi:hypothetical protein